MGKKGSWFSAIKRVFTYNSKQKPTNGSDKKSSKEKKGRGILRHGESKSLIPLFREPSSIEKILGEADQLLIRPPPPPTTTTSSQRPKTPPRLRLASPKATSLPHLKDLTAPKVTESRKEIRNVQRPEPTFRNQQLSATKIQTVFRGYLARRSFRALRGLVRLQEVVRGHNVKRQTMNAMKQMQMLVRVQTQIQSRRIQMLENHQQQAQSYKEVESTLSKWTNQLSDQNEDWDDSLLTKQEEEARLRKKVEAVIKRERAMAYAYSHKLWKANPKSAQSLLDIRSNGFPWWWNWLERHDQLPEAGTSHSQSVTKSITFTPPRPNSEFKPSPRLHNKQTNFTLDNHESLVPRSSRTRSVRAQQLQTPPPNTSSIRNFIKYSKSKATAANSSAFDDDSLMSCPPFSVPNYMTPTVSAKAKARANSNPKDRFPRTPGNESNRRFSFPLTPNIAASFKGGGSNKDSTSQIHNSSCSIGKFSAISMPALVGRKPFNRFV